MHGTGGGDGKGGSPKWLIRPFSTFRPFRAFSCVRPSTTEYTENTETTERADQHLGIRPSALSAVSVHGQPFPFFFAGTTGAFAAGEGTGAGAGAFTAGPERASVTVSSSRPRLSSTATVA